VLANSSGKALADKKRKLCWGAILTKVNRGTRRRGLAESGIRQEKKNSCWYTKHREEPGIKQKEQKKGTSTNLRMRSKRIRAGGENQETIAETRN